MSDRCCSQRAASGSVLRRLPNHIPRNARSQRHRSPAVRRTECMPHRPLRINLGGVICICVRAHERVRSPDSLEYDVRSADLLTPTPQHRQHANNNTANAPTTPPPMTRPPTTPTRPSARARRWTTIKYDSQNSVCRPQTRPLQRGAPGNHGNCRELWRTRENWRDH